MEKVRCKKTVAFRQDESADWEHKDFDSINQAKKFNGLNSRTVQKHNQLPQLPKQETPAA